MKIEKLENVLEETVYDLEKLKVENEKLMAK